MIKSNIIKHIEQEETNCIELPIQLELKSDGFSNFLCAKLFIEHILGKLQFLETLISFQQSL